MEILSEDGKTERIVWFSEDEWQILSRALDLAYGSDVEMSLRNRYGEEAEEIFMRLKRGVSDSVGGDDMNLEYITERRIEKWTPKS